MSISKYKPRHTIKFDTLNYGRLDELSMLHNDIYKYNNKTKRTYTYEKITITPNNIGQYTTYLGDRFLMTRIMRFLNQNELLLELLRIYDYDFTKYEIDFCRYNFSNDENDKKVNGKSYFNENDQMFTVIYIIRRDCGLKGLDMKYYETCRCEFYKLIEGSKLLINNETIHSITPGRGFGCMDFIVVKFRKRTAHRF